MRLPTLPLQSDVAKGLTMATIFAIAGLCIGLLLIPPSPKGVDPNAPGPAFSLLGQRLPDTADAAERSLQLVRRYAASNVVLTIPGGGEHLIARSALGAQVERTRLARLQDATRDPASTLRKRATSETVVLPVPVILDNERAFATLLELKDLTDRPAVDARLDLESRKLLPEQDGIELDVHGTLAKLQRATRLGEDRVEAVVSRIPPRLRSDQLGNVTFDKVLGYFETNYARGAKHELRTFNLRLAASRLDGHVILPGEVFDFNAIVGPRDEAHGYKIAPVIAEGELVDGIGGGTCQISGTLHAAAYFAGLEVVARRPHTRPSSYIKMGLDAAVSFPTITLRMRNRFDVPVVLHETVKNGVVRAEILGPDRKLTVTYVRKVVKVTPYEQVERNDSKLPAGTRVLAQRGVPGFRVQKYRIVRDGPFAVREKSYDTYPPTSQIVRVGVGESTQDAVDVQDDPHPEYVADEYLVITQGPGVRSRGADADTPGGPTVERRVAGWTGERGWYDKAGFPAYEPSRGAPSEKNDGENTSNDDESTKNDRRKKDGGSKKPKRR